MIYEYATTPANDPKGPRVCLIRQQPGEYRDFTGLPLVCKAVHKEYTTISTTLTRNPNVTVYAEDVSAYIQKFYPGRNLSFEPGDMCISYTAYGQTADGSKQQSPQLDLSSLIQLQGRRLRLRISFLCYLQTKANPKPMYWDQLTNDFNRLFCSKPCPGPEMPGARTLPTALGLTSMYFCYKPDYKLFVTTLWPQPILTLEPEQPAIIFKVQFTANKHPSFPFAQPWRSSSTTTKLAHTIWHVGAQAAFINSDPVANNAYDVDGMDHFLANTGLYSTRAYAWCLNIQRDEGGSQELDPFNDVHDGGEPVANFVDDIP